MELESQSQSAVAVAVAVRGVVIITVAVTIMIAVIVVIITMITDIVSVQKILVLGKMQHLKHHSRELPSALSWSLGGSGY